MRILLAEDDARLAEPLVDFLERERHSVTWVCDGTRALAALLHDGDDGYELALLDWMLPGRDGLSIVRELRGRGCPTLVMMLTARDALSDLVEGLGGGADDYLVKPFRMVELAARIRSLERRSERACRPPRLRWGSLALDPLEGTVWFREEPLALTHRELQLLEWFLRHPGQLVSRSRLRDQLWSLDADAGEDTVKTHLNNLRRKVKAAGCGDPIETVHGQGYRLVAAPQ